LFHLFNRRFFWELNDSIPEYFVYNQIQPQNTHYPTLNLGNHTMPLKNSFWIVLGLIAISFSNCALAEEKVSSQQISRIKTEELISHLGSPEFSVRDLASKELLSRGKGVLAELQDAADNCDDLEIRLLATQILQQFSVQKYEAELTALLNDPQGKLKHDLPCWLRYKKIMGHGKAERELFVEMLRNEQELLTLVSTNPRQASKQYAGRIKLLYRGRTPFDRQLPSEATLSTFLFLNTQTDIILNQTGKMYMFSYLTSRNEPYQAITAGSNSVLLKRLLSAMAVQAEEGNLAYYHIRMMMRYNMKEASLKFTRKILRDNKISKRAPAFHYATLVLGKYGGKEDLPLLEPLLKNKTVIHTWNKGKVKKPIKTQICDLALVALLKIHNQDHKAFGFKHTVPNNEMIFQIYSMGFEDEKQREAAIAKWQAWKKK